MKRKLLEKLTQWKSKKGRKPLILKGVRQCGKTFLLKSFGEQAFARHHYINFEKNPELHTLFRQNLDPRRIINELNFHLKTKINIEHDLLILDEIQACPPALTSLKYFQEDMAELALCSAGSLLGLTLNDTSFPVGKVDFLQLHPMSFSEFITAVASNPLNEFIQGFSFDIEIPDIAHQQLWEFWKHYLIVGGLPEAVDTYRQQKNHLYTAFEKVREKQSALIKAYYADIAKHTGKINAMHIDRVWNTIPDQLARTQNGAASKFIFKDIIPGINRYNRIANVIDWLQATELTIKTPIVNSGLLPSSAYAKENTFKLFCFDVGILTTMSKLSAKSILDYDYGTYKGYIAENFVAQAFTANNIEKIYSWHERTAEVEFLRDIHGHNIPIEVKSGNVTKAKSLQAFSEKYQPPYRIILSGKNLLMDKKNKRHFYPIYLAEMI